MWKTWSIVASTIYHLCAMHMHMMHMHPRRRSRRSWIRMEASRTEQHVTRSNPTPTDRPNQRTLTGAVRPVRGQGPAPTHLPSRPRLFYSPPPPTSILLRRTRQWSTCPDDVGVRTWAPPGRGWPDLGPTSLLVPTRGRRRQGEGEYAWGHWAWRRGGAPRASRGGGGVCGCGWYTRGAAACRRNPGVPRFGWISRCAAGRRARHDTTRHSDRRGTLYDLRLRRRRRLLLLHLFFPESARVGSTMQLHPGFRYSSVKKIKRLLPPF